MTIISVSVPEKLLERVELFSKEQGFSNRSEIIRQALRTYISESKNIRTKCLYCIGSQTSSCFSTKRPINECTKNWITHNYLRNLIFFTEKLGK